MATFPSQSAVAQRLGNQYEIQSSIGQPFGYQQLRARDLKSQRSVVIKSLTVEEKTPTGDICCFEREIHLLKSLSHPTIPEYVDDFSMDTDEGKGQVLVQTHQGGQTLEQYIKSGKEFSEAEIKSIAKQLLQGLIYFHSKGLVHRDIKPSNISLVALDSEIGQASWLNLGTVQYLQAQRPDALVGTYGYMPPEQVGGQAAFTSDLYSLGATLVYLTLGRHLGELPRKGYAVQFACSPSRLSGNFQQWINWLIEPRVANRPASAKQALGALNHLPLAMLKQRLCQPKKAQLTPVPITTNGQARGLEQYQPFFTKIQSRKSPRALALTIPAVGIQSSAFKRAVVSLGIGSMLLGAALYLLNMLELSATLLASTDGLATLTAAILAVVGCVYSWRFLSSGLRQLQVSLLRQVQIQIESDVLLVSYRYWLRSPIYIVNTKRECIYNISALPDGSALRILTHHNRTQNACLCYKLTVNDGMLSRRDVRWLTSLLNEWRTHPGCM
ncbi:MAG: serine/threonine-protein kinase [Cyanobacteria bacterium J06634_6]